MVTNDLIQLWLDGQAPSAEQVADLQRELPWWTFPAAMRLRNASDLTPHERAVLAARLAAAAPSLDQMSMAVDVDLAIDLARFYPLQIPQTPDTDTTIEKFLETYGHSDSKEDELLERLIFNPTPDYAQLLAQEEEQSVPQAGEAPEGSADALINSFIIKAKAVGGQFPAAQAETEKPESPKPEADVQKPAAMEDASLSESLARGYIRRGNYDKAYQIISELNLNFPEKSIYFADQLRFLSKLIALKERNAVHTSK